MVVFPAPSSPRMRILISRVPNKLEKMVEKKPPTKNRKTFQCQPAIWRTWKRRPTGLISYWATICSFSLVRIGNCRLLLRYNVAQYTGIFLLFYRRSTQQNQVAAASAFLIVVRIFFSFSLICWNLRLLYCLYQPLSFQCKKLYKDTPKPERILSDVYGLPQDHPLLVSQN